MRKSLVDIRIFKERRKRLAEKMQGSALVVAAHPEHIRNHDVHFGYRQDSNLFYLTGFEEPESVLIFRPGMNPETVLFVRKKDKERETWDGFRFGPEGAEIEFQMDKCHPIEEFETLAPNYLKGMDRLYYRLYKNSEFDLKMQTALEALRRAQGRTGYGLLPIYDADEVLGEMRVRKSDYELDVMRTACRISAEAHIAAMKYTKPGKTERDVLAVVVHKMLSSGAAREGYNSIIASGNNATTLHYVFNDMECKSGDLLLIDAGAEYHYYTGDITRTFPVNGKFTDEQALVYEGVLRVQKSIINTLKPGIKFKELHDMGSSLLTDLMLELGLLSGRKSDIIEAAEHKKYYPHGIGHWLGMDVHDAGLYFIKDQPRAIEENMCFTIEPGLYIPADDTNAPAKFRGIGIRIEDNIRITADGCENMTASCPKEVSDIENIMKG